MRKEDLSMKTNFNHIDNYKGEHYDNDYKKYIDPITGAHFSYEYIYKKLQSLQIITETNPSLGLLKIGTSNFLSEKKKSDLNSGMFRRRLNNMKTLLPEKTNRSYSKDKSNFGNHKANNKLTNKIPDDNQRTNNRHISKYSFIWNLLKTPKTKMIDFSRNKYKSLSTRKKEIRFSIPNKRYIRCRLDSVNAIESGSPSSYNEPLLKLKGKKVSFLYSSIGKTDTINEIRKLCKCNNHLINKREIVKQQNLS